MVITNPSEEAAAAGELSGSLHFISDTPSLKDKIMCPQVNRTGERLNSIRRAKDKKPNGDNLMAK